MMMINENNLWSYKFYYNFYWKVHYDSTYWMTNNGKHSVVSHEMSKGDKKMNIKKYMFIFIHISL